MPTAVLAPIDVGEFTILGDNTFPIGGSYTNSSDSNPGIIKLTKTFKVMSPMVYTD